ncbi:MAG TPA: Gfo/Idh/MocA family oxidoreductase [Spirochaetes bacterium]|nr:Gfo/Idh/MocA family oxidoreductase [Spirochaetota bacterium]
MVSGGSRASGHTVSVIVVGAGNRGEQYAAYSKLRPSALKIVAVAEPVPERRLRFARQYAIPDNMVFSSWEDALSRPQMADGCVIATQDTLHVEPAVAAMERGYHVLLEKPMALTEKKCRTIAGASKKTGMTLNICHVLRYTDFFSRVKEIIDRGALGNIYSIYHAENVPYYHMAHSYVRGNWRNSRESSPMILAKCCHDLDLIYWFAGSSPSSIASFGGLHHFTPANAPEGAPERCTDGCPAADECPYEAVRTYLHGIPLKIGMTKTDSRITSLGAGFLLKFPRVASMVPGLRPFANWRGWPVSTITEDLSVEGIMNALRSGPYGRCVYRCDNDQVDHQATAIEFENGITAMLNMHGHAEEECRTLRIDGSLATLRGKYGGGGRLEVHIHRTGKKIIVPVKTDLMGHTEGDVGIMENFVKVLRGGKGLTTANDSLQSHLMAFAAHRSRVRGEVVRF